MLLAVLFAFLAGLVTVASPCILPILPIALSTTVAGGRWRPLGVVVGLAASFAVFTLAITQIVAWLGLSPNTLRLVAIGVIALLGLGLLVPALNARLAGWLAGLPGLAPQRRGSGLLGGLLTGATLGLVWAPCAGPVLAAVTALAATRQVTPGAVAVTLAYALGVGVPLLVIAYGGKAAVRRIPGLARRSEGIQRGFGALMILTAVLMAANVDVALTAWATAALPADWNNRLQAFEETPLVRQRIDGLLGQTSGRALIAAAPGSGGEPAPSPASSMAQPASAPSGPEQDQGAPQTLPALGGEMTAAPAPAPSKMPAPTATPRPAPDLPDAGPAPDFVGITGWLNSPALHVADLRGKVVLVDFWTYSCINCIRTLPYVTGWYQKYHDQGLVVIGVHTPEFAFEHDTANVRQATQRYHITYPVAQDNDYATWTAYQNLYWPAEYFIDARGHLRYAHFGEGNYDETERVIQELLTDAGATVTQAPVAPAAVPISEQQTPETYVGLQHQGNFASSETVAAGQAVTYHVPARLPLHSFALDGAWTLQDEYAQADTAGDRLELHFAARDVYLVMASDKPAVVQVSLPGSSARNASEDVDAGGLLHVTAARLYHLARLPGFQEGTVELQFTQPGVRVYAFTFGS